MNRQRQLSLIASFLIFLIGCAKSVAGPTDSETHFLNRCKDRCAKGLACICGVCTKTCEDDQGCSSLPANPTCVAPELLDDIRDCRPSDPIDESVCDVECESDSECKALGKGFGCHSGFCRESANSVPAVDGSIRDDSPVGDSQGIVELSDATVVEDSEVTTKENTILFGGLAPGERAPAIGDVPWNAYGGPAEPVSMVVSYPRTSRTSPMMEELSLCDNVADYGMGTLKDLEQQPCVMYFVCINSCLIFPDDFRTTVVACDNGGSGNATPVCIGGECELRCDDQSSCPDGMVCVTDESGSRCWWPLDIAAPECPAFCDTDPLPPDCPNWCASKAVSCGADPSSCCEGLICGPEGLCIEDSES